MSRIVYASPSHGQKKRGKHGRERGEDGLETVGKTRGGSEMDHSYQDGNAFLKKSAVTQSPPSTHEAEGATTKNEEGTGTEEIPDLTHVERGRDCRFRGAVRIDQSGERKILRMKGHRTERQNKTDKKSSTGHCT